MATHSSIPAWEILWTEVPGRLQSVGSQRVGHDLVTKPPPPQLIYNVVLISGIQHSDSHIYIYIYIYIHIYILFQILFHCRLLQDIEYSSLCYMSLLFIAYSSVYMLIPNSQFIPSHCFPC